MAWSRVVPSADRWAVALRRAVAVADLYRPFFVWLRRARNVIVQISICMLFELGGPHTSLSLSTVHLYIVIICMHARGPAALVLSCVSVETC